MAYLADELSAASSQIDIRLRAWSALHPHENSGKAGLRNKKAASEL